ncbi:hypothetical protein LQ384_00780 [Rhodococcus rhodochrous]|uniref:Uridine kinase n=1 Tax=Rhodococcus rhodochrous TaxID=1829 RepID=A0AAW4X980_RHORH|nr:hypothetical protein [Rhodococcus rhodochrous]MCD2109624.1 hypothetical protein [Rhodococcus rhodochrous]
MPAFTPLTPEILAASVADRAEALTGSVCIAVSAPDAADPVEFAQRVATELRTRGRAADVVDLHDFVRPASLRLEHGRTDPYSYRHDWFDYAAVDREVLRAVREHQRWLPRLWDERTDRSARERPRRAAEDQILVVAGPMLLGRGLDFDVTVVLTMSRAALERRTRPEDHWTIDAVLEHEHDAVLDHAVLDHSGADADVLVRYDHPTRPAVRTRYD